MLYYTVIVYKAIVYILYKWIITIKLDFNNALDENCVPSGLSDILYYI